MAIEGNKIENNNGAGIKIGIANKASIIRNEIKQNQIGIEVASGEPFIFSNKIDKNFTDGILTYTHNEIRYSILLFFNFSSYHFPINFLSFLVSIQVRC